MEKISRSEAQRQGLTYYFTGKPCKHGHVSLRQVDGGCVECRRARDRQSSVMARRNTLKRQRYDPSLAREKRLQNLDVRRKVARESAKRRRTNPDVRNQERISALQYRAANLAEILARQRDLSKSPRRREMLRRWRESHPEKVQEARDRWRERHPARYEELGHVHRSLRRARRSALLSTFSAADWRELVSRSTRCHWCKRPFNGNRRPTHDHVIPIAKGGTNTLENSCCACAECNFRKHARLINPVTGQGILL
jgi:hypothetical protein